jgi:hypothetical protein
MSGRLLHHIVPTLCGHWGKTTLVKITEMIELIESMNGNAAEREFCEIIEMISSVLDCSEDRTIDTMMAC